MLDAKPSDLSAVTVINASHNGQLRGDPDGGVIADLIRLMPNVTRLDFSGCQMLRELPDALGTEMVPSLRACDLRHNLGPQGAARGNIAEGTK